MTMNTHTHFEELLKESLSHDTAGIAAPDPLLVFEARQKVLSRKKEARSPRHLMQNILQFFTLELRFYHVGLSLLLISAGFFYVNEPNYSGHVNSELSAYHDALSTANSTISVNSSTMLTSIPTLVIRN